jgi:ABC-type sugar transport system ATPase subunit
VVQHGSPSILYRSPNSQVVGNLLGPLGANWFDLEGRNGDHFRLCRPKSSRQNYRFVGFRPEDFQWKDGEPTEPNAADTNQVLPIQATVLDVQHLGFGQLIVSDWHGHRIRILRPASMANEACQQVNGMIPHDKLMWVER